MKPKYRASLSGIHKGFTLIELVGVLAIMAIMAGAVAPNAIRALDRAAVRTEQTTLRDLGEQVRLYVRDNGSEPTAANWYAVIASYASLSPTDLQWNSRQSQIPGFTRVYIPDPIVANHRALLISSMRAGVAIPPAATISSNFATVWATADGSVPAAPGWAAWNAANIEYLVMERINFRNFLTITLNNKAAITASYNWSFANGTSLPAVNIAAGATAVLSNPPMARLNLYRAAGGVTLDYSYVLSTTGKTFDFNGTTWTPQ